MYSQDWSAYNEAQTNEKMLFMKLLDELSAQPQAVSSSVGRPKLNLHDMIFSLCLATYCGKSSRRATSELELAKSIEFIRQKPHFNTLLNYFKREEITPILHKLVAISSLPLKQIESDFAVDSSGFSTSEFDRWFEHKWGIPHNRKSKKTKQRRWIKAHVMCGVKTNVITSIEITDGHANDTTMFVPLVNKTSKNFNMVEVSADKAYLSRKNLTCVDSFGARPFIPFKSCSVRTARRSPIWSKMYDLFQSQWYFKKHYHKRSNVETVFAMMKRKFSPRIRTKNFVSQTNELLCMAVCHNICVLIQEMYELGIKIDFNKCANEILHNKL